MTIPPEDIALLKRDKYDGADADMTEDLARLMRGEPLAYVIGWIPFHGLRIELDGCPLIPRVETEHWTEALINHLKERFKDEPFALFDLCAGSGAIGLSVLKAFPNALVSFAELDAKHADLIKHNIAVNALDASRASVYTGDLFAPIMEARFDVIATNPPYIPSDRVLPESVSVFEPSEALFAGADGLSVIDRILIEAPEHLNPGGELWLECDVAHAKEVRERALETGAISSTINEDQYGRPRVVVSYYE